MTIQKFPLTKAGETAAKAVPEPKNMSFEGGAFVVRTGADYVPPAGPSPEEVARQYAKLAPLLTMTPAQIEAWGTANITTLASARDAIIGLAVAVSVLMNRV